MKSFLLIPILFLVTACDPRDTELRSDSQKPRPRGSFGNNQGDQNRDVFLGNYAVAVHMVERQLEALSVLQMSLNKDVVSDFGFEFFESPKRSLSLVRRPTFEKNGPGFVDIRDEKWSVVSQNQDELVWAGTAQRWFYAEHPGEDLVKIKRPKLKMGEWNKLLKFKKIKTSNKIEIDYVLNLEVRKDGGRFYDGHNLTLKIKMLLEQNEGQFKILESVAIYEAEKEGDARWVRDLSVKLAEGFVIKPGRCSEMLGTASLMRGPVGDAGQAKTIATLSFSKDRISETSGRWSDPVQDCAADLERPSLDLSRLFR